MSKFPIRNCFLQNFYLYLLTENNYIDILVRLADETDSRFVYQLCERVVKSNTLAYLYMIGFILKAYSILLVSITFFADQLEIFLELIIGESTYDGKADFYRFLCILSCVVISIPFLIPKQVNMLQIPGILTCISSCSIVVLTLFIFTEHKIDQQVCLFAILSRKNCYFHHKQKNLT